MNPSGPVLARRIRALGTPVVRTRRLDLVRPSPSRLPEIVVLISDRRVARWTLSIPYPYTIRDGRSWLRRARLSRRGGRSVAVLLVRRSDRALVGGAGIHHLDGTHRKGELGYWIGRPYRRRGYGAEAAEALTQLAFRRLGLHRVEARVFPGNSASIALLRSLGFHREGRLRESVRRADGFHDELVFARTDGARGRTRGRRKRSRSVPQP